MLSKVFTVLLLLDHLSSMVTCRWIHQSGVCSYYRDCGKNPEVTGSFLPARIPCVYNGPAIKLYGKHLALLKSICPMIYNGDQNTYACCSMKQLTLLDNSLSMSKPLLSRCPSCLENFVNLYCQNTCSPNQSLHINITRTFPANLSGTITEAVLEYQCYYDKVFADGTYDSCKNVRIPATGGFAISPMCGKYGSQLCNTERWLAFQGDSSNGLAPLDIDFVLLDKATNVSDGIVPYDGKYWMCNESMVSNGEACSCLDCEESCPVIPSPVPPAGTWMIGQLDGILVICIVVFCILVVLFVAFLVRYHCSGRAEKADRTSLNVPQLRPEDVKWSHKLSGATQQSLGWMFRRWGTMVARYPVTVICISFAVVSGLSAGMTFITLTTSPVELWSAPNSRARQEKAFHDANFGPFFRTNQIIITVPNRTNYTYDSVLFGPNTFSGIFAKDIILELLDFQSRLQNISVWSETVQRNITIADICYAPLNPENPRSTDCAVNSVLQYFQNDRNNIEETAIQTVAGETGVVDWRDHFLYCINSPLSFKDNTELGMSCMADYGAPVFPYLAVGGYTDEDFTLSEAFIMTFSLNNYETDDPKYEYVMLWEREYLKMLREFKENNSFSFSFVYMSERSLEDEISRTTLEDLPIFAISYLVIFVYIALALGEYTSWRTFMIESKITLGLGGILVVLGAVLSAMGFYCYVGVPASLVILEVVPFLVLAIGADNIFILVLQYQRDERKAGEQREEQIGRVLGDVAPSMLLCSMSESVCLFLGALAKMPAVRSFALYAALAVLIDFLLQMSAFVALMSLDSRRSEAARIDICCCIRCKCCKSKKKKKKREGLLLPFMRGYYAPFLLHSVTRIIVLILFLFMFCAGIFLIFKVQVGLDQELSLPTDSYMLDYFAALNKYFEVGVPVYFVTKAGYNFSTVDGMNGVCSSVGCDNNSMTQKIQYATKFPDVSYLSIPASSWVDDFIDWLNPISRCCRLHLFGPNEGEFCPATSNDLSCRKACMQSNLNGIIRPTVENFSQYLPSFLNDTPTLQCSKGGLGAYGDAVKIGNDGEILASRFMAYQTPLKNSSEYTAALKVARQLADNIQESMRQVPGTDPDFEVFPYSITYVYYEQYLTIATEGMVNLALCLIPTFVVCCILLGMDIRSGLLNLVAILMIIVDTVAVMTLWNISYNAVSLINLVTAIGMSVEFVSHLTRSFAISTKKNKVERAKEATATMGSAVFAGVAMTNLPGIIVLYFAQSQLIQIFFFRLNLVITLLGMAHGLVFLPVFLSYFGPNINTAVLLRQQKAKEQTPVPVASNNCYQNFGCDGSVEFDSAAQCNGTTKTEGHGTPRASEASLDKDMTSTQTLENCAVRTVTSF
ncbi:LOW QUALITY PROTEIN: NPC1-like intracellular cholesterol transporter 1 [Heterodontus francisci]|uniref:LOW QUALITY PROTEIN: NPC1-like intracellular cholesterol transporter 1 n=1 Tax=Heterodontus francisci TaxID=7792 RepID=UPI00355B8BF3